MITFDQRAYDFQAVGEFIFVESPNGDFQLQTRQKPWVNNRNVSVNRAFATKLGGSNVVFDAELAVGQELKIGGVTTTLTSGQSLSVGNSRIQRQGNQYTLIYAGPDGVISTSDDDEVTLRDFDSYLNITVCPANYRGSQIQGLLGNADGVTANDFALRDGTSLGANPTWQTIHTTYADSWRITQGESLFVTTTFADKTLPERETSLGTLPRGQANAAVRDAFNAGLPAGPILDGAALDAAATGDNSFITNAATTFADVIVRPDQRGSLITLDIAPNSVNEDGTQNLVYTFTRTGNTTDAVTVNYNVGGTATVGTDYTQTGAASFTGTTGTITFAPGATTATVTIDPTVDTTVERNETVDLTLVPGTGYIPETTTAVTGTIVNAIATGHGWGDVHMLTFDQRHYDFQAVGEFIFVESPNSDFQLQTRQKPYGTSTRVSVNTAFATKLGGSSIVYDTQLATGQELKIGGVTTTLRSGQSLSVGNGRIQRQGTKYTLTYAGPDGVISTSDDDVVNVNDRGVFLNIDVSPADYRGSNIQGLLGNADGVTSNDFTLRDGTSLGANPSRQTIHTTYADSWRITQSESLFGTTTFADKTFPQQFVTLANLPVATANAAVKAAFNAGLPEGPILDGAALDAGITGNNNFITDAATAFADVLVPAEQRSSLITLDIAPTTANEDETNNLVYTFSRTGSTTNALTVNYSVAGTGTFGTDYTQTGAASFADTTGTITFAAGAATATVTIDPTADTTFEANETVALSLASGTGYVIGATPAVIGTIVNDDSPTINLSADRTVVEGTTSPQTVSYTLTLSDRSTKTITVQYATANGTATAGLDYTSVTGTLTFNPGVTSQVINIPILNDSINEADETFTLNLSSPTNVNLGTATTVTTITDTLTASVTTTLANVENLTLTGTSAINGTGNVGNNILTGNTASNSLSGGAGNDTIIGGGGDDTYSFPATTALGSDTITEVEAGGIDTIDFTGTTVAVNVNLSATTAQRVNSNLNLSLSANNVIENATGGTGSDRITGNTLNNTLNGGDGNDQLQGLGGDDILWGRAGNDILSGGSGNDQYLFQGTGSFTTGLGVDYINEFVTGQDQILLSQATFNAITNVVGQPFTDFAVVADDESVDASNARIVYSQNTGSLFYNQNGNVLGATGVFVFASLGNPDITLAPNDFSLVV